jgi:2-polyprenyl-3-methyl-5-hydroxy-6-metoxy-1,4-benzoquinol methylase
MASKDHWEKVYSGTMSNKPGWYTPHLQASLCWINQLEIPLYAPIIDVGCGISTFSEDLLDAEYRSITVLDISGKALSTVKK